MSMYPACCRHLTEALEKSEMVCITDIDENGPLQLRPCPAQVILQFGSRKVKSSNAQGNEKFDKLFEALHSIHAKVIAVQVDHNFPGVNAINLEHLLPLPEMISCDLWEMSISTTAMTTFPKCANLLNLRFHHCDLHGKLSTLMASPPPALKKLELTECNIQGADVDHVTQAVKGDRLTHLKLLGLSYNPIGELALSSLVSALISSRFHKKIVLIIGLCGVDKEDGTHTLLHEGFVYWCMQQYEGSGHDWQVLYGPY